MAVQTYSDERQARAYACLLAGAVGDALGMPTQSLSRQEIRRTYEPRVRDLRGERTGLVQLILNDSALLFSELTEDRRVQCGGTPHIIAQPEFKELDDLRSMIRLIEDDTTVIQLLERQDEADPYWRAEPSGIETADRWIIK